MANKRIALEDKIAIIKTINGEFEVTYTNSRDFVNSIKSAIERKTMWEFVNGNTRTFINCANIVSIEMCAETMAISPFSAIKTDIRKEQLALQPGIIAAEKKAELMNELKEKEEKERESRIKNIYGK